MIKKITGDTVDVEYYNQEFTITNKKNDEEITLSLTDARMMREMFDFIWSANNLWKYDDRDHTGLAVPMMPEVRE